MGFMSALHNCRGKKCLMNTKFFFLKVENNFIKTLNYVQYIVYCFLLDGNQRGELIPAFTFTFKHLLSPFLQTRIGVALLG